MAKQANKTAGNRDQIKRAESISEINAVVDRVTSDQDAYKHAEDKYIVKLKGLASRRARAFKKA